MQPMQPWQPPPSDWTEPFRNATRSAVHLEMRDSYGVATEAAAFGHWRETGERDNNPGSAHWRPWVTLIRDMVARGVVVRRARITSEPVSDYIKYEHAGTHVILSAGELVRWLPRRLASDLALPGNDFWLFDDTLVRFGHFTGDGALAGHEIRTEPSVIKLCADSFEAVWQRGIPHEDYKIS